MTYSTNDFRGEARAPINVADASGEELYIALKEFLCVYFAENPVPIKFSEEALKSGGLFGTKVPMVLFRHPDPSCKYFTIGMYVVGSVVNFPLIGKSEEQYKYNSRELYQQQGKWMQAALYRPDEFKIQQEFQWQADVLSFVDAFFS